MAGLAWRLLLTGALDGPANMAIDEAVLRARQTGVAPPTVRFFGWRPPTVSLGYGQPLDDRIDEAACARLGFGLVRRPTGGSAILHGCPEHELTYSVVAKGGDFAGVDDVLETYRVLGAGLVAGLAGLGIRAELVPRTRGAPAESPVFCFGRAGAYEIAVRGRKLVGSAQRRQGGTFLQHGSILLDVAPGALRAVFPEVADPLAGMTTVAAELGRRVEADVAIASFRAGLAGVLGHALEPGTLSPVETDLAGRLVADKYGTEAWTRHGAAGRPALASAEQIG
jgi:lipoate-protein ligase A